MPDKQNILITTSSFDVQGNACLQEISRSGFNILTNPYARRLSEEEVHDLIQELEPVGLIAGVEPLTRKVMQASSQLKVLSRCGSGCGERIRHYRQEYTRRPDPGSGRTDHRQHAQSTTEHWRIRPFYPVR